MYCIDSSITTTGADASQVQAGTGGLHWAAELNKWQRQDGNCVFVPYEHVCSRSALPMCF